MTWPPAYTLKTNPRARHVRLKASIHHGLEIIVPERFNPKQLPEIIEINKLWIEKQLAKITLALEKFDPQTLPPTLILAAINQTWKIIYIKSDSKKLRLFSRPQQELVLLGDIDNKTLCKKLLSAWLKKTAENYLVLRCEQLSAQTQLSYQQIFIRGQRSRWGSCSPTKTIHLNYKLLFLPANLVDHIILHELCHTVHLNHSAKFWRLVAKLDPQWKQHSRETRRAEKFVPAWVEFF